MDAAYRKALSRVKCLSRADAIELRRRMLAGDTEARDRLVESILRLVYKIATRMAGPGNPADDLVSEGNILAMRAVERWEPERGKLSTIAYRCIVNGLTQYLKRRNSVGVYAPTPQARLAVPFSTLPPHPDEREFDVEDGREPSPQQHCLADVLLMLNKSCMEIERKIFRLRYEKRLKFAVIAERTGLSASECKLILGRLIKRICRVRECKFCGDKFAMNEHNLRYCSPRCYRLSLHVLPHSAECAYCLRSFRVSGKAKYCSGQCSKAARSERDKRRTRLAQLARSVR